MSLNDRVRCSALHSRIMSAADAAALIPAGANVGMSGFTGAGYPKALPQAIAAHAKSEHAAGRPYKLNVWTGASTAAECDGVMAEAGAIGQRLPFNTDPIARKAINAGDIDFIDMHLSHVAQHAWFGFLGPMHVAVVETHKGDRDNVFAAPDANSNTIAASIIDFLSHEMKMGRLPKEMLPIQSGVGNVANAVLAGLLHGPFENLLGFTEVLQDGMLDLLRSGKMARASATAISLSSAAYRDFEENIDFYRDRIILRPQEISNHPELVRRLGVIAMNSMIEADIYGNINSTHVMGSSMMNGIGGSGDFARNGYLSFFVTPSVAKNGHISCIVPMCSHVDHTEHDTQIIVTEQGLADLRGLSPKQRAKVIIERCAHPDFRPMLQDYVDRAMQQSAGLHTPHILTEALSWHQRYLDTGSMKTA